MARPSPRMRLTNPSPSTPITPRGISPLVSPSTFAGSPSTPSRSGPSENTYQRTFRAIHKNVTLLYSNWTTLMTKWKDSIARIEKLTTAAKDKSIGLNTSEIREKRRKQEKTLEDEQIYLLQQFEKMYNQVEQLKKNHQKAEELLLEMSKRKGLEAAFAEPLFLTWPLARFVDALAAFSDSFILQFAVLEFETASMVDEEAAKASNEADEEVTPINIKLLESRRRDFMEICEVELQTSTTGNG